jgi:hypothetical protein
MHPGYRLLLFDICLMFGAVAALVVRMVVAPLLPTLDTSFSVIGICFDSFTMRIIPPPVLAFEGCAGGLLWMKERRIEGVMAIGAYRS